MICTSSLFIPSQNEPHCCPNRISTRDWYNLAIGAMLWKLSKNTIVVREDNLPSTSVVPFILLCSMCKTLTIGTILNYVNSNFFVSLQLDNGCLKCLLISIDEFSCEGLQDDPFWTQNPSRHLGVKHLCITSWDPKRASWTLQGWIIGVSSRQLCLHLPNTS